MFGKFFKILSPMQWVEFGVIIIVLFSVFNFGSVVFDGIKEKFGMETKSSLKEQTIKQAAVIDKVVEVNTKLVDTIKTNEETAKVNKDIVVNKLGIDLKIEEKIKVVEVKKAKVISDIKIKYSQEPSNKETQSQMELEVSRKQITFLWDVYCTEAGATEQCKNHKNIS